jgi:hypothetical protein
MLWRTSHTAQLNCAKASWCILSGITQVKCFQTHVDVDIFPCVGMWNSCPKFSWTFQLHPVYVIQIQVRMVATHNMKIWNSYLSYCNLSYLHNLSAMKVLPDGCTCLRFQMCIWYYCYFFFSCGMFIKSVALYQGMETFQLRLNMTYSILAWRLGLLPHVKVLPYV